MKNIKIKAASVLLMTGCLFAQAPLTAFCADGSSIAKAISLVEIGGSRLLFDESTGAWYDQAGNLLADASAPLQTALYEGKTYTVDLNKMQVSAADGGVNDELTALLPQYLAFRPLTVSAIDGQYLDELFGTETYEAAAAQIQQIVQSIPLTYRFSDSTELFYCEISLGSEVLGGMQYSIDANDYPEAVPWCNDGDSAGIQTAFTGMGDVNVNGRYEIADAILLARYIAEDAEAAVSSLGRELADMDGDSLLRAEDLVLVLRQLAD